MEILHFNLHHQFVTVPWVRAGTPSEGPPPEGRVPGPAPIQGALASGSDSSTEGPHECSALLQTDLSEQTGKSPR